MHRIHAAWQLVDVGLNDDAVVEGDRCVADDVVVHWVRLVKGLVEVFGGLDLCLFVSPSLHHLHSIRCGECREL